MEIQKPSRRRRHHPEAFKQAVIEACCEPGASVAGIAMANSVNANQVRRWMRERGIEPPTRRVPMPVLDTAPATAPAFVQLPMSPATASGDIRIEIRRAVDNAFKHSDSGADSRDGHKEKQDKNRFKK